MATLIKVDGTKETIIPEKNNGKLCSLEQMQKAVGGYIELVYLPDHKIMVVDEEGICKNKEQNTIATNMANQIIVGDVLIIKDTEIE